MVTIYSASDLMHFVKWSAWTIYGSVLIQVSTVISCFSACEIHLHYCIGGVNVSGGYHALCVKIE